MSMETFPRQPTAPGRPVTQTLRQQLVHNMVDSESMRHFLPDSALPNILTKTAVELAIAELDIPPDERIHLADAVQKGAVRLFAILLWIEKEDSIVLFRAHEAFDDRLPFSEDLASHIVPDFGRRLARDEQWRFLPFSFPPNMHEVHREIDRRYILPFVERSQYLGGGSFGQIFTVHICPSQQAFVSQDHSPVQLILKKLKPTVSEMAYRQEIRYLRLLNQKNHSHIIPFFGSYAYNGQLNFLFPRLDIDLKKFFTLKDRFSKFHYDVTFYSALRGLCSALLTIHDLHLSQDSHGVDFDGFGYHHNIRPANILLTEDAFILANFGLGNLKHSDLASQTAGKQTNGDYLAPECMEGFRLLDVGRSIDVWAIGCLIMDVVTYIHQGCTGINAFSDARSAPDMTGWTTSSFFEVGGNVKPQVHKWLLGLPTQTSGPGGISTSPLVELSLQILTGDTLKRPKALGVCKRLTFLSLQAYFTAAERNLGNMFDATGPANRKLIYDRLSAWGHVLGLDTPWDVKVEQHLHSDTLDGIHDNAIEAMRSLVLLSDVANESGVENTLEDQANEYVVSLWHLLPAKLASRGEDYWQFKVLSTDDTRRLEATKQALSGSPARFSEFYATRALAMMKMVRLSLLDPQALDPGSPQSGTAPATQMMDPSDVIINDNGVESYGVGKLNSDGAPVLVEWMRYTLRWQLGVSPEQRSLVMNLRAQSFATPGKPRDLRTLECLGIFEQQEPRFGYGWVYRIPPGMEPNPVSLFGLLNQDPRQAMSQPYLGNKFKLAAALAKFLKEFHTVGWLHENFNSHNVLFFTQESAEVPSPKELQIPYFVGLHKSRPDGTLWQTDGPDSGDVHDYQHPDYAVSRRYRIDFDYYSLGIVLLEIGLWRPLSSILAAKKYSSMGAAQIRDDHIRRCKEQLGPKMGQIYQQVVIQCLGDALKQPENISANSDTHQGDSSSKTASLGQFIEKVVEPLEALALASI